MPQLMPLLWLYSTFMSILLILILIEMYFYKENLYLSKGNDYSLINLVLFKW